MIKKGVYKIQSQIKPERIYVGSSSNLVKREKDHFYDLRHNRHGSEKLQRHYNKYGKDDLVFEIIEWDDYLCNQHLLSREQGWFGHFRFKNNEIPYFNTCKIAGNSKGMVRSKETREKISKAGIGRITSEETKKKQSESHIGKNTWTKGRISPIKGIKKSEQAKENMSNGRIGMKFSDAHIESLSKSHMGVKHKSTPYGKDHGLFGRKVDFWAIQNRKESYFAGRLIKEMEEINNNKYD